MDSNDFDNLSIWKDARFKEQLSRPDLFIQKNRFGRFCPQKRVELAVGSLNCPQVLVTGWQLDTISAMHFFGQAHDPPAEINRLDGVGIRGNQGLPGSICGLADASQCCDEEQRERSKAPCKREQHPA